MQDLPGQRQHQDILEVFAEEKAAPHGFLRASAPMVRYSKLEFRHLLRNYGVRLTFTPMIIADSFGHSQKARANEFTTSGSDAPLIAQFAASNATEFANAAELIYPYVDGVDVNCGCPQSWAISKGYGCGLLRRPEVVHDIVRSVRRLLPADFSVSVKIRLLSNESVASTVNFARQLEMCGITFLTLHGRTAWQRTSDPLNVVAMAEVKRSLRVPLIVNGNVRTWQDACELYAQTNADGVMAARGLLSNPTLFDPESQTDARTSLDCVQRWLDIAAGAEDHLPFQWFHHHLTFMWSSHMKRKLRQRFNNFTTKSQVFDFFDECYDLRPAPAALAQALVYTDCTYSHVAMGEEAESVDGPKRAWCEDSDGKYFKEFRGDSSGEAEEELGLEGSFFTEL